MARIAQRQSISIQLAPCHTIQLAKQLNPSKTFSFIKIQDAINPSLVRFPIFPSSTMCESYSLLLNRNQVAIQVVNANQTRKFKIK